MTPFHPILLVVCFAVAISFALPHAQAQQTEPVAPVQPSGNGVGVRAYDAPQDAAPPVLGHDPFSTLVLVRPDIHERSLHVVQLAGSASGGYDTATDGVAGANGYIVEGEGHAGVSRISRRYDVLLEHDAKVYRSFAHGFGLEQYQHTTAWLSGAHSPRTDWALVAENAYGSADPQIAGSLTDLSSIVVVPAASTAVLLYQTGNALYDHAQFNLQHQMTRRDTLSFDGAALFRRFFSVDESDSQYNAGVSLRRQFTEAVVGGVQLEGLRQSYGQVQCTTASVSVFGSDDLSRKSRLTGSIGFLDGTSQCHATYIFDGLFQYMSRPGTLLFFGADRRSSDSYVQNTAWQTSVFGGVRAGRVTRLATRIDAGWTSYESAQVAGGPNVSGFYASGELRRNVGRKSDVALTLRYFDTSNGATRNNRTLVFLTYAWSRATPEEREENLGYGK